MIDIVVLRDNVLEMMWRPITKSGDPLHWTTLEGADREKVQTVLDLLEPTKKYGSAWYTYTITSEEFDAIRGMP